MLHGTHPCGIRHEVLHELVRKGMDLWHVGLCRGQGLAQGRQLVMARLLYFAEENEAFVVGVKKCV